VTPADALFAEPMEACRYGHCARFQQAYSPVVIGFAEVSPRLNREQQTVLMVWVLF
jgi:hypothetical protein